MNTPEAPAIELTAYQKKLKCNLKYYHKRYLNDDEFREKEIKRNSDRVKDKYANDPEYRERIKQQALDRYYRLKAAKEAISR